MKNKEMVTATATNDTIAIKMSDTFAFLASVSSVTGCSALFL